jgi:Uncharacterized protein conserved in bacteria
MILLYFAGFAISLLFLLIGLIKPSLVLRRGTKRTRGRSSLLYGVLTIAFLVGMIVTTPDPGEPTLADNTEPAQTPQTAKQEQSIINSDKSGNQPSDTPKESVQQPKSTPDGKIVRFQMEEGYKSRPTFYEGEVNEKGQPHGKGKIFYEWLERDNTKTEIIIYEGEFQNGTYHGKGTLYNGDKIEFSGVFQNGEKTYYPYENEFYYDKGAIEFYGDPSKTKTGNTMKVYYTSGNLYYEGGWKNRQIAGDGTIYYINGKPKESGNFKNGELEGKGKKYYESGIIEQEGEFEAGVLNGKGKLYHPNGKLKVEGTFKDGKLVGKAKVFDKNGNLVLEGKFDDGRLEGDGIEYYENGKVKYRGSFKEGQYHGKGKLYNDSGEVIQEGKWNKGIFVGE